ncbi:MAG: hypothetical protein ABSG38_17835 [Spirochaetia bacterium]|jgi:hypothetical protein
MASSSNHGPTYLRDAKEYARFCRIRGIFLVDGLGLWRSALKARGLTEEVISAKVSAALHFIQAMEDPSSEPRVV